MVTYNERVENMSDNDIYDTYLFNNHIGKVNISLPHYRYAF